MPSYLRNIELAFAASNKLSVLVFHQKMQNRNILQFDINITFNNVNIKSRLRCSMKQWPMGPLKFGC